jgi:TRAP-type mannitol/chloroaromatic compound transport system substrate-binding protein
MDMVIGFLILGLIVWSIYKMFYDENASLGEAEKNEEKTVDKAEEVKPAPVASLEPVVNVAREKIKADIDAKTEEAFVKAMVEETTKLDKEAEEVIKEVVATVEPVVEEKVEEVEEVEEVVEKVKKGRKAKAK